MKRSAFNEISPSTSMPSQINNSPPAYSSTILQSRDSDLEKSTENLHLNYSPLRSTRQRSRVMTYSSIDFDSPGGFCRPNLNSSKNSLLNSSYENDSPDRISFSTINRSLNGSGYGDHLQQSITFARQMETKASNLSNLISNAANLSMSYRHLFSEESSPPPEEAVSSSKKRKSVHDIMLQTYGSISQQVSTSVERFVKYSEVCPDKVNKSTPNRFMRKQLLQNEQKSPSNKDKGRYYDPIFNSFHLLGTFSNLDELSRTPLAVLYKARHRINGLLYCIKRSRSDYEPGNHHGNSMSEIFNEVQALSLLQHRNIISYYTSWFEADSIHIQLEFCFGGSLFNLMYPDRILDTSEICANISQYPQDVHAHSYTMDDSCESVELKAHSQSSAALLSTFQSSHRPLSPNYPDFDRQRRLGERSLLTLAAQMISALNYMHSRWSIVHGDVKPSNILIQFSNPTPFLATIRDNIEIEARNHVHNLLLCGEVDDVVFKLADFGRSSKAGEDMDGENLGDGRYLPALNDPSPPSRAATGRDIYALGVTIYDAAGGLENTDNWTLFKENKAPLDLSKLPESLHDLVSNVLQPIAIDRPTANDLINSPLIQKYFSTDHVSISELSEIAVTIV